MFNLLKLKIIIITGRNLLRKNKCKRFNNFYLFNNNTYLYTIDIGINKNNLK